MPVSAIIILYHSKHLLEPLLANITEKIANLDDVILVDNSNEDLTEFESSLVKIVHPRKNIGYGAAINLGVSLAKNNNIVAFNPDISFCLFDFDFSKFSIREFLASGIDLDCHRTMKFPTLKYDFFRYAFFYLSGLFWPLRMLFGNERRGLPSEGEVDWFIGCLIITNKRTFSRLQGFDEEFFLFCEEVDLCKRANNLRIPVFVTSLVQFHSLKGKSSSIDVSSIKFRQEMASLLKYHSKYSGTKRFKTFVVLMTFWCRSVGCVCSLLFKITNIDKFNTKGRQYTLYFEELASFYSDNKIGRD